MTWRCSFLLHKMTKDAVILESLSPSLLPSPVSPHLLPLLLFLLSLGLILSNVVSEWHCISRLFLVHIRELKTCSQDTSELSFKISSVSFIHNSQSTPPPEALKELHFSTLKRIHSDRYFSQLPLSRSPRMTQEFMALFGWETFVNMLFARLCGGESFWTLVIFLMQVKNKNVHKIWDHQKVGNQYCLFTRAKMMLAMDSLFQ